MINKKLMAMAAIFFLLAIGSHIYIEAHPAPIEPSGFTLDELLGGMEPQSDGEVLYNLDSKSVEGSVVSLYGWALMEGRSTEFTNTVIGLQDETGNLRVFTTEKVARPDVSTAFGDSLYEGSGFSAKCDMNGFPAGNYTVILYFTDAEQNVYYYSNIPVTIIFDGEVAAYSEIE
ncbi:MAG: hypothetical protein KHZ05_03205 [Oscillospiraceae bacterium]|nr:hypothetical protein [Oscillospiraceae bacterium]